MKALATLSIVPLLCIAQGASADQQADFRDIARAALVVVEREDGPITAVIAPDGADPALAAALRSLRRVTPREAVPKSKTTTLPKGYLIVEKVRFEGNHGTFTATAGPGVLKDTLGADVDCGKRYIITMWREHGRWANGPYQTQECHVDD